MDAKVAVVSLAVPIVGTLAITIMVIMLRKFQNDERMSIIEKGMTIPENKPFRFNTSANLTYGFMALGAGLGLFISQFISSVSERFYDLSGGFNVALVLIGGGLGLVVSYFVQYRMDKK